jgi:hypothetical protein
MTMVQGTLLAKTHNSRPVVVSAGRRVDAPDAATPRFPGQNVARVRKNIEDFLAREQPVAIVASAACGSDLLLFEASIALAADGKIAKVQRYVLLPSPPEEFRKSSVIDRPGDWGTRVEALVIWNMQSRGADDVTGHFLGEAENRRIPVTQISTV